MPPIASPTKPPESLPSKRHEAEEADPHAEPERTDVEQVAACEQQSSERDERDRQDVGGASDDVREHSGEPRADGAAVEAEIEDRCEDEPEREQCEPEQLVLVGRALSLRPRPFFTREGTRGRSGRFFLLAAMGVRFCERQGSPAVCAR